MGTTTAVAQATSEEAAENLRLWTIVRSLLADIAMAKTLGAVTTAALMASLEMDGIKVERAAGDR